ncbi:MAG: bifunctional transcriptional activator/DNA repair protein Ada [bacterium]|nr:bifunctional transcriptional activator/DNA repair protein Ada [bacterium]
MKQLTLSDDRMYEALLNKDPQMEGIFVIAVKTTGIFCRSTCTARKPKRENVEFFETSKEALAGGYRPCKVCNPMEYKNEAPSWLKPVMDAVTDSPDEKITDYDLREKGLDPNRVRRWFKKNHNMTFQAYQRLLRIGNAFGRIKHGEKVADSAFNSGYDSLSSFNDAFKKEFGTSPVGAVNKVLIKVTRLLTPLGPLFAGACDAGIVLLEFVDRRMLETQIKRVRKRLKAEFLPGTSPHFDTLDTQLKEYFAGTRKRFTVPLVTDGTDFQQEVWRILREIPYGATRSYKDQAKVVGNPAAVRAVARANGDNRIAIIIPCHRVIGSNGEMVGYGGGIWRKQYLLDLEQKNK